MIGIQANDPQTYTDAAWVDAAPPGTVYVEEEQPGIRRIPAPDGQTPYAEYKVTRAG